jgi:hypothetical protein
VLLGARSLEPELAEQTLGIIVKHGEDRAKVQRRARDLIEAGQRHS